MYGTEFSGLLDQARSIAKAATTGGRDLTPAEYQRVGELVAQAKQLKAQADRKHDDADLLAQMAALGQGYTPDAFDPATGQRTKAGRWGATFRDMGRKALDVTAGGTAVPPAFDPTIHSLPSRLSFVRSVIPVRPQTTGDKFDYLRQTVRTNNAAPVAPGATKPTSVISLEKVEDTVHTIAHLSEALRRQQLSDIDMLESFIESELRLGLLLAEEDLILNGVPASGAFTGIMATSGTLAQAYSTSLLVTTRKAVTVLEDEHLAPDGWVLNPSDWETVDLSIVDTQAATYPAGPPLDRARRQLWGIPVVVSTAMAAGTGLLGAFAQSSFIVDREQATVDWSENIGDDFAKNLRRYRAEERLGFAVTRPRGFVEVDLTP